MDDKKSNTHALWRYCGFCLGRLSFPIYISIWTGCLFEALCCLRACETPWDRVQPCVGKKMSRLPRNRGGAEKCSVEAGRARPLHPVQKSEILILNQLNERFLNTSGRLLCVSGHEQVLESPLSRPVTYKSSNMGGPRRQCLPTILSSLAPKKWDLLRGRGVVLVRCSSTPSPYLVPTCQLALNTLFVSPSVGRGGGRQVFSPSRTSQTSRAPTGHIGAVCVNDVRRKHRFDWPRGNSVWPNPGASGLFNSGICRCIHTPADRSIWTETKVLTGVFLIEKKTPLTACKSNFSN